MNTLLQFNGFGSKQIYEISFLTLVPIELKKQ